MSSLFKRYSLYQLIILFFNVIRTKFLFKEARIIRFPFDVRGKKFISISKGFTTGVGCRLEAYPTNRDKVLFIGKNVQINDYVHITAMEKVSIGNNVLMASKIYISDCTHGSYSGDNNDSNPKTNPSDRVLFSSPVIIKDNVWLGESVSILPGVIVGEGTIVGANSVVAKSLPDFVIAVGIPAKPIKKFNFQSQKWEKYL
ncbi:acetyltransferase [Flavobacterium piscis]|uniref:Acetyltransferase-like isoleucine patch superfamily enzyme n=1 Tax=Flavobacterium piscis TaxID=1114874 RepID=A0ABU1Y425_9FLAO|nr:acetyltransferase [Flavobacterium piscis]MDR7208982.1 acetyltransferase-like isoleucine patch superfamily enzyme [Flavobacterium piscis]